jgi:succinate dehydrogenase / fumarate reductase cytochrome b subunit
MGVTGAMLFAFVIIHMIGNLQIFLPPEAINQYAKLLKASPEVLWGFRLGLLGLVVLHLYCAASLTKDNCKARPQAYATQTLVGATWASRTMAVSGVVIGLFLIFHILHFTAHVTHPEFKNLKTVLDGKEAHDVYSMVVMGFSNRGISLFYVAAVGLLCVHLTHGVQSFFQSLGLVKDSYRPIIKTMSHVVPAVIFIGMSAVPLAVLSGAIKPVAGHKPVREAVAAAQPKGDEAGCGVPGSCPMATPKPCPATSQPSGCCDK